MPATASGGTRMGGDRSGKPIRRLVAVSTIVPGGALGVGHQVAALRVTDASGGSARGSGPMRGVSSDAFSRLTIAACHPACERAMSMP